jgi:hypothetical protein
MQPVGRRHLAAGGADENSEERHAVRPSSHSRCHGTSAVSDQGGPGSAYLCFALGCHHMTEACSWRMRSSTTWEAHGYTIIRPETMSLSRQIIAYNAVEELVFAEGSALHLYAPVARPDQRVFVIWRRKCVSAWKKDPLRG